jgi:hypothetical protein
MKYIRTKMPIGIAISKSKFKIQKITTLSIKTDLLLIPDLILKEGRKRNK